MSLRVSRLCSQVGGLKSAQMAGTQKIQELSMAKEEADSHRPRRSMETHTLHKTGRSCATPRKTPLQPLNGQNCQSHGVFGACYLPVSCLKLTDVAQ